VKQHRGESTLKTRILHHLLLLQGTLAINNDLPTIEEITATETIEIETTKTTEIIEIETTEMAETIDIGMLPVTVQVHKM
jgi:hypothetical protein